MAQYICDGHAARYAGPQRTAYPALSRGATSFRSRRRLCGECFDLLATYLRELDVTTADPEHAGQCAHCHHADAPVAVFSTLYDLGADREDTYARVCQGCAESYVSVAFFGASLVPGSLGGA